MGTKVQTNSVLSNREFYKIILPSILSSLTIPLLGSIDSAVIGQLKNPEYIAAVSVGTNIFNTIYWLVGFLRTATIGFSAQLLGKKKSNQLFLTIIRPLSVALLLSFLLFLFQNSIFYAFIALIQPKHEVIRFAYDFYHILIWGAPFILINYVLGGFILGQAMTGNFLKLQISAGILSGILDYSFVLLFHWNIKGLAAATLLSQIYLVIGECAIVFRSKKFSRNDIRFQGFFQKTEWKVMFSSNSNLLIRTICLVTMKNMFLMSGASFGTLVLAANGIMSQINSLMIYALEGIGSGASVFAGKAKGLRQEALMKETQKKSLRTGILLGGAFSILYFLFQKQLLFIFTNSKELLLMLPIYSFWICVSPLSDCVADSLYGMYIGAGKTAIARNAALCSFLLFFLVWKFAVPHFGNHGLWLGQILYWSVNSVLLFLWRRKLYDI